MNQSEIEHMAQGLPPSQIGKDHEEVVIWLSTQLLDVQQKLDVTEAKVRQLEWDSVFIPKDIEAALAVMGVALPESKEEFNFSINRWIQRLVDRVIRVGPELDAERNNLRAEGVIMFATKQLSAGELDSSITLERLVLDAEDFYEQLRGSQDGE